ncbi:hypothetical protein ABZY36_34385 [Streptomyces sp. NPDC006627]|uniref:hypothetical protein n=1 Tax=Streptomyces sp. NPDC006627 TaxID=3154679 RepID=UPI0033B2A7DB
MRIDRFTKLVRVVRERNGKFGAMCDRGLCLTWIATAQARRRDLDAAAVTAAQALDVAAMVESGRCTSLLTDLAADLEPYRAARPVTAALERLASTNC